MRSKHRWELFAAGAGALGLLVVIGCGWAWHERQQRLDAALAVALDAYQQYTQVKALIRQGADPHLNSARGRTALMLASAAGDLPFMDELLDRGLDPNAGARATHTPLIYAAVNDRQAAVELLLRRGADARITGYASASPVIWAARNGNVAMLRSLVNAGADPEAGGGWMHVRPLLRAVMSGRREAAAYLLAQGAEVTPRDRQGNTPLSVARENGDTQMIRLLTAALARHKGHHVRRD